MQVRGLRGSGLRASGQRASELRSSVFGLRSSVFGLRSSGLRARSCGLRSSVFGLRASVFGLRGFGAAGFGLGAAVWGLRMGGRRAAAEASAMGPSCASWLGSTPRGTCAHVREHLVSMSAGHGSEPRSPTGETDGGIATRPQRGEALGRCRRGLRSGRWWTAARAWWAPCLSSGIDWEPPLSPPDLAIHYGY